MGYRVSSRLSEVYIVRPCFSLKKKKKSHTQLHKPQNNSEQEPSPVLSRKKQKYSRKGWNRRHFRSSTYSILKFKLQPHSAIQRDGNIVFLVQIHTFSLKQNHLS